MNAKSTITIAFDPDWIACQRKYGFRVIRILEEAVRKDGLTRLRSSTRTSCTLETDNTHRADMVQLLANAILKSLGELLPWAHATFSGDLDGLDVPRITAGAAKAPDAKREEEHTLFLPPDVFSAERRPWDTPERKKDRPSAEKVLRSLCEESPLKHEPELAAYLRDVATVVPRLRQLDAMDHFWRQHILVSIDDGWGFTAFRKSLCTLFQALELVEDDVRKICREIVIGHAPPPDPHADWKKAVEAAQTLARDVRRDSAAPILCLDISAWQEKLSSPEVKEALRKINDAAVNFICVLRVTFTEPGVLHRIEGEIDDVLNIRSIAVAPARMDEMVEYVCDRLSRSDFRADPTSHEAIEAWILREMADGSFFGYKTLDKMASRIIYDRVLSSSADARPADIRVIDAPTLRELSGLSSNIDDPEAALSHLIGMAGVKKTLEEIVVQLSAQRELSRKGRRVKAPAIHMAFSGAPGTGKTTIARIAANLLKKAGLLRKGHLVEVRGRDLCGEYIGETAPKTSAICRRAAGSVLFIDEAYSLWRGGSANDRDYGREALDTLVAEMENHRDDFCVILAGYPDEMETMLKGNVGLGGRIPHRIQFPNYTREELGDIFLQMLDDGGFAREKGMEKAVRAFFAKIPEDTMKSREFSNARLVRNLYERVWGKAAYRRNLSGESDLRLLVADLDAAAADHEFQSLFEPAQSRHTVGFGQG